ncbi:MAG: hydrogenase nickel incorporation protein HypB [Candidatus Zixiibacteriota bacterium]|nr:MAG: hydrogenase nickel incorporation protein HypB [candidate division Zixibacteria bacterium]
MSAKIKIEKKVLSENDKIAAEIRERLHQNDIVSLNFVSSPGSGKTSLLEKTIARLGKEIDIGLIAGDVQTENDANRLKAAGGEIVRPVVTGGLCHLDARMISKALENLDLEDIKMLFIENVGNLVCPSSYDLGEDMKVVLVSVTEGDDKPLKYPAMFRRSSVMIINKTDLLPHCDFNMETARMNALKVNGKLKIFEMSCRAGDGLDEWYLWLKSLMTR